VVASFFFSSPESPACHAAHNDGSLHIDMQIQQGQQQQQQLNCSEQQQAAVEAAAALLSLHAAAVRNHQDILEHAVLAVCTIH
jgi:hypothetical protein